LALCGLVGWLAVGAVDSARRRDAEAERLSREVAVPIDPRPAYPRDEFERLVLGKTETEIRLAVGSSNGKRALGSTDRNAELTYRGRTLEPATGQRDTAAVVLIRDGKAVQVTYP
jgi:hypothetical protein